MNKTISNNAARILCFGKTGHLLILVFIFFAIQPMSAQQAKVKSHKVAGTVYELTDKGVKEPLSYATVSIADYSLVSYTDNDGRFVFNDVPEGSTTLVVRFLGKVDLNIDIAVTEDLDLSFVLEEDNFRLKDVVVISVATKSGQSSSSVISKKAMEHLQANSLGDALSLLPGGLIDQRNLNSASQINLRTAVTNNMNAMGASVIIDGAPLSNNANLQAMNPTVAGATASLAGGASPAGGSDIRTVSMDNVESIEVIRGVPSVEYGDVTSGVVLINSKAGVEPLWVIARASQNVYELSAGKGTSLGKGKGALNVSADYTHNINDPVSSYRYYQRGNAKLIYSNLLKNIWRTNTSLDLIYGRDRQKENPDDAQYRRASNGEDVGFRFNSNGTLTLNKGLLKNFVYKLSTSYTAKDSYAQENYSSANAPYSMTTADGTILSNRPNRNIYDENGNAITNFGSADAGNYAIYLPSAYFGQYTIEGREFNLFGKGLFNLFQKIGNTDHRIIVGGDFKLDKNYGEGKKFDPAAPPYRNLSAQNATFRPRKYSDIPAVKQLGLFVEESFTYHLGDRRLGIQAGLRYDHVSVVKGVFSPRFNASIDIVPDVLSLKGGYGITAKAPTLLYLYPENAYFEYVNVNELTNENIPEADRVFMTTTRSLNVQNRNLKIAKNKRAEIGFDLQISQAKLNVTAFSDRLDNGYSLSNTPATFSPFTYNAYVRDGDHFKLSQTASVLSAYTTPTNSSTVNTKGVEFDLNLGRFDAIRTAFSVNGAWLRTKTYNNGYYYYDPEVTSLTARTHVALYEQGLYKRNYERLSTAIRVTHNIPELGFVVTLTGQTIWKNADWYNIGDVSMPVKYISKDDGLVYDFDPARAEENEFKSLIMNTNDQLSIKESSSPVYCFNINLTKGIGQYARMSFFANNMFRSYPISESKRTPGTYRVLNEGLFTFGVELALTIK